MMDIQSVSGIGPEDLDEFVSFVDAAGGPNTEEFRSIDKVFKYVPKFEVDQSLDPFSDTYLQQMLQLYEELSGRSLDQETGELTPIDVSRHAAAQNPYASEDIAFISKHARAVLTALMVANPPDGAHILDLGCGWGLSTEMMNFAGAKVTAVDINPQFIELVDKRAKRHERLVNTVQSNFDDLELTDKFDMAFFYECLHHSVKPWETIANIEKFLTSQGRIVLAGEPINGIWWRHWGLRLDALSIYCIRKFGWFESGWTHSFLEQCFEVNGWHLHSVPNVGLDNGVIGVAERRGTNYSRPRVIPATAIIQPIPSTPVETPPAQVPKAKNFRRARNIKRRLLGRPLL